MTKFLAGLIAAFSSKNGFITFVNANFLFDRKYDFEIHFCDTTCFCKHWCCKEKPFVIPNINKMDQDKTIFCQAATTYTEIFKEEGKSEVLHLNVLCEF